MNKSEKLQEKLKKENVTQLEGFDEAFNKFLERQVN